jgi:hypothetical protein
MWGESLLRRPYRDHGGLTPAALYVCACAYRKSRHVCGERTPCTKSGGRQPPVVRQPCLRGKFRTRSPTTVAPTTGSGGRKPPVDYENALATTIPQYAGDCRRRTREPHSNRSSQNHGAPIAVCVSPCMCVVEPRRAHARRSCEHAFAYRKNRFFAGRRSDRNQERGA